MRIKNAKRWAPSGPVGYFVALGALLAAFLIRYELQAQLGSLVPFGSFSIVVLWVQTRYGAWRSMFALALSIPVGLYFFVPPYETFDIFAADLSDILAVLGYAITMGLAIFIIESLQRARYESKLLAEVSRTRYEVLLRSESERQSAVTQARQSRDHFRTFANNVGEVVYMKRMGGGFEYVSDVLAKFSGVPADDLIGDNWLTVMHPEDAASIAEQIAQITESRQSTLSEFRLRMANGLYIVFEGKMSAMEDERGLTLRWTGGPLEAGDADALQTEVLPTD